MYPDLSIIAAGSAGLISFLSPCILPIVPFYLCYIAGIGMNELSGDGVTPAIQRRVVFTSFFFAAGILTVFVGLGATATVFGQLLRDWFDVLRYIAAAVIFILGLHFVGAIRLNLLLREARLDSSSAPAGIVGAYLVGLAFAFGWTPCVGPVLATILFTASASNDVSQGMLLLFAYGVGMTLPFILAAMFSKPFLNFMARFRRHLGKIEKTMGVILIAFAVLIATNTVSWIAELMINYAPGLTSLS
ncbi:cytochrome c biogenesis protein CcdA [Pseudovibrio sp. Tun.PSC04-5.I4]|uniref:cytochrome c biogenesis CcdA family protein n=1 Tax=Pseudovibrio sp. Tun.PSC04-5.I4 TaxID=1798213 RepID=UPI000888C29F|nr:cytochrome c biogenesis protein CcdA [Pseudovibrio sp. Tun.PSC04-5.I4]SDQ76013.1 cytochrome c-type biogenesis protein [Pseudovibrio sp. Tun.PSC04-5.I4]